MLLPGVSLASRRLEKRFAAAAR